MRPGEVADGPWIQASSRSSASSTSSAPARGWPARHDRVHRLLEQRALLDALGRRAAHAAERHGDVDVALAQLGERLRRAALGDRDLGVGHAAAQVGDRQRDEPGRATTSGAAIRTRRCSLRDQVADLELGEREPVERGAGVLDQQRAGRGQLRPAARAVDERRADLGLERGEVLGDRGLGEVERGGGAGQRAVVGDRAQRAQAPDVVHKCSLS